MKATNELMNIKTIKSAPGVLFTSKQQKIKHCVRGGSNPHCSKKEPTNAKQGLAHFSLSYFLQCYHDSFFGFE